MNPQGGYNPMMGRNNQIYDAQIQNNGMNSGHAGSNPNLMKINYY